VKIASSNVVAGQRCYVEMFDINNKRISQVSQKHWLLKVKMAKRGGSELLVCVKNI
jgi:hypothetical protein